MSSGRDRRRNARIGLISFVGAVATICIGLIAPSLAQEPPPGAKTAPAPQVQPGSYWIFKDTVSGREVKFEIKKVTKDYVTTSVGGRQIDYTHELNPTEGRALNGEWGVAYQPDNGFYSFPLWVGKKTERVVAWTYRGDRGTFVTRSEVVAIEPVAVPSGTFEAFKVTNMWDDRGAAASGSSTCWYAVETRRPVKCEVSRPAATWELIKYELR